MAKAIWTPEAREDLKQIVLFIGRRDRRTATAAKIAREIKAKCDDYATHFAAGNVTGTLRRELGENYRVFSHKRWVIIFRPSDQGVEATTGNPAMDFIKPVEFASRTHGSLSIYNRLNSSQVGGKESTTR